MFVRPALIIAPRASLRRTSPVTSLHSPAWPGMAAPCLVAADPPRNHSSPPAFLVAMKGASFRVSTTFINWVSHSFFAHATHTTPSPTGTAACVACCDCPRVPRVYTHTPSPTSPATRPLACFQSSHVIEQSRMEIEALLGRHRSGPPWEYRWLQYHLVHQITQLDSDALRLEGHDGSLRGGLGCDTGNRSYTTRRV